MTRYVAGLGLLNTKMGAARPFEQFKMNGDLKSWLANLGLLKTATPCQPPPCATLRLCLILLTLQCTWQPG